MPMDIRHIIFPRHELLGALREHRERCGEPPLPGHLQRLELAPEPGRTLRLTTAAEGGVTEHTFSNAELTGVLVGYCLNHRIPLPRGAKKAVGLWEGDLALVIRWGSEEAWAQCPGCGRISPGGRAA